MSQAARRERRMQPGSADETAQARRSRHSRLGALLAVQMIVGGVMAVWQARIWLWHPWDRPFPYIEHAAWLLATVLIFGDGLAHGFRIAWSRLPARIRGIGRRTGTGLAAAFCAGAIATYGWAEFRVASLPTAPAVRSSRAFLDATVAMEDGHFYSHHGFDWAAMHRALRHNLQAGRVVQGGSSITQQTAKNVFLSSDRTVRRKVLEAFLTLALERRLSKRRILDLYVARIDYGLGARGITEASRLYFRKSPSDLDLAESAVLVGLVPSPPRRFLTAEALEQGRQRAVERLAFFFGDRYSRPALDEAGSRPLDGFVLPYLSPAERGATASAPATIHGVSFRLYTTPAVPRAIAWLQPEFAVRLRRFARAARAELGLTEIVHLGAYVDRLQRGSDDVLSAHALGRAMDLQRFVYRDRTEAWARPSDDPAEADRLRQTVVVLQRFFPRVLWHANEPIRHRDHIHIELPPDIGSEEPPAADTPSKGDANR